MGELRGALLIVRENRPSNLPRLHLISNIFARCAITPDLCSTRCTPLNTIEVFPFFPRVRRMLVIRETVFALSTLYLQYLVAVPRTEYESWAEYSSGGWPFYAFDS